MRYAPKTDILVVADHSSDGTGKLADEMLYENAQIHVLHHPGKVGRGFITLPPTLESAILLSLGSLHFGFDYSSGA